MDIQSYKGRTIDPNSMVDIYRNLHKESLSIRTDEGVAGHAKMVHLHNAKFHVGKSGNSKVKETGVKNVHAYVKGIITSAQSCDNVQKMYETLENEGYERVKYNPKTCTTFVKHSSNEPITEAYEAIIVLDRVYIKKG